MWRKTFSIFYFIFYLATMLTSSKLCRLLTEPILWDKTNFDCGFSLVLIQMQKQLPNRVDAERDKYRMSERWRKRGRMKRLNYVNKIISFWSHRKKNASVTTTTTLSILIFFFSLSVPYSRRSNGQIWIVQSLFRPFEKKKKWFVDLFDRGVN